MTKQSKKGKPISSPHWHMEIRMMEEAKKAEKAAKNKANKERNNANET